jgi:hypothetical protein
MGSLRNGVLGLAAILAMMAGKAAAQVGSSPQVAADACVPEALRVGRTLPDPAPAGVRVVVSDQALTQEFKVGRINVELDGHRVIVKAWCG